MGTPTMFFYRDPIYKQYENLPHIKLYTVHPFVNKFYFRYFIDHQYLRIKLDAIQPDVIFSMGNVALPVTGIPQVLLFHIPHILYPESDYWNRVGQERTSLTCSTGRSPTNLSLLLL